MPQLNWKSSHALYCSLANYALKSLRGWLQAQLIPSSPQQPSLLPNIHSHLPPPYINFSQDTLQLNREGHGMAFCVRLPCHEDLESTWVVQNAQRGHLELWGKHLVLTPKDKSLYSMTDLFHFRTLTVSPSLEAQPKDARTRIPNLLFYPSGLRLGADRFSCIQVHPWIHVGTE